MEKLIERFLNYTRQHTTSDPKSDSSPSTARQLDFAARLAAELKEIGLSEVELDEKGYLTATIPANTPGDIPVVGLVAHIDTSPDFNGDQVNPQIIPEYNGGVIELGSPADRRLDPAELPELKNYIGQTLITTDGSSLLGADNKAGVAEIVTAAEILLRSSDLPHGKIRICFTPDEEIGRGADHFDVQKFGATFAYTIDGGEIGELEYENFNAAHAVVTFQGKSVHPGAAKNKMVNAQLVAHRFIAMLPQSQRPEHTEQYEGFFHLLSMTGNVEQAALEYLVRDHDSEKFRQKKELLHDIARILNAEYGNSTVKLEVQDQYYNMRQKIEPVMYVVELAEKAMKMAGVQPKIRAIRGGTDGARLSYMGLPCPNIFTGGHNFHGPYEFIPVESMQKSVEVILHICQLATKLKR